jgi:purine-nucleoside/S-methyl-5'-thioadenosine phosphorylase / adenosine deaminase
VSLAQVIELPGGARAAFTARVDGNLSSVSGGGAERGEERRERLRAGLGLERLARGYQVHGTVVRRLSPAAPGDPAGAQGGEADGQATSLRAVGTMVLAADCLPVALGCPGAVAMIHAGWRGLAAGVLEEGVAALRALADPEHPEQLVAVVGPCAGPCCYEVGPEVHAAFDGAHRHGRRIDLRAIAHDRLAAAGASTVRDVGACTICDERYFSHRREGAAAGRQAGIAWLS